MTELIFCLVLLLGLAFVGLMNLWIIPPTDVEAQELQAMFETTKTVTFPGVSGNSRDRRLARRRRSRAQ